MPILISRNFFLYKMKGAITIDAPVKTGMIQIGYARIGVSDFERTRGILEVYGDIVFKGRAFIMHGSKIIVSKNAELIFGDDFSASAEVTIIAEKRIVIGNGTGISWQTQIMDTDFHYIADENGVVINEPTEIIIGNKVWIGCRCNILKGSLIPDGCVVGSGSLITKKLSGENNIFGGNPTRILKSNITWWF
ncbi:acyltransferase [Mucilaginibacter flavus]|uniref:acyltransferase n=1 Tax=Mucilaginibacter flavus TaxID=931504 RepID=UPI0025B5DD7B|nr:hypothetical protein [Mucilaginibacter flavus]MDN3584450.1 hypothetical protein [Mucilaginibacter flavus]